MSRRILTLLPRVVEQFIERINLKGLTISGIQENDCEIVQRLVEKIGHLTRRHRLLLARGFQERQARVVVACMKT
jgi:hypothetical protein